MEISKIKDMKKTIKILVINKLLPLHSIKT
jgi:hypothetical protein